MNKTETDSARDPLLERCERELKEALRVFGTYSFDDKGPEEVMGVDELTSALREAGPTRTRDVVLALGKCEGSREERLASSLLVNMQDWDELWNQHGSEIEHLL